MTTKLFKILGLFLVLSVIACAHDPSGDDDDDDGDVGPPDGGGCTDDCQPDGGAPPDDGGGSGSCEADDDCAGCGMSCVDGACAQTSCCDDGDCPEGEACEDGVCVCDGDEDDGSDGACKPGKDLLCHYPPGNPAAAREICVGAPAVPSAHQAHGDTLGGCP